MTITRLSISLFISSSLLLSANALAWGERGHDLVTRVAVKNLRAASNDSLQLVQPFKSRDHMLSHLSNVPDIVWRADYMSELDRKINYPTHFINLEKVYPSPKRIADLDTSYTEFSSRAKAKGFEDPSEVGTAPWRILQLQKMLVSSLKGAGKSESKEALIEATNQALLYAGIMSHFVGDLSNPHHTTANYDGQLTGNNGLHAFFESDVVSELPMNMASLIEQRARGSLLELVQNEPAESRENILSDPSLLVFALVVNSNSNVDALTALDDQLSIIRKSPGEREPAVRKAPLEVQSQYQDFAVSRLAMGAAVLSQLWKLAWVEAGSPDLSSYRSYEYPVKPDFIMPDYLE